jgi:hypothetical protein
VEGRSPSKSRSVSLWLNASHCLALSAARSLSSKRTAPKSNLTKVIIRLYTNLRGCWLMPESLGKGGTFEPIGWVTQSRLGAAQPTSCLVRGRLHDLEKKGAAAGPGRLGLTPCGLCPLSQYLHVSGCWLRKNDPWSCIVQNNSTFQLLWRQKFPSPTIFIDDITNVHLDQGPNTCNGPWGWT